MDENRRAQEHMLIKSKQQSQAETLDEESATKKTENAQIEDDEVVQAQELSKAFPRLSIPEQEAKKESSPRKYDVVSEREASIMNQVRRVNEMYDEFSKHGGKSSISKSKKTQKTKSNVDNFNVVQPKIYQMDL